VDGDGKRKSGWTKEEGGDEKGNVSDIRVAGAQHLIQPY
jgi:hypothetical protein